MREMIALGLLAACGSHDDAKAKPRAALELVDLTTTSTDKVWVTVHVTPPEPGTVVVDFVDDVSKPAQHCSARLAVDKLDAKGVASVNGPVTGHCVKPTPPAGFLVHVGYERAGQPVLEASRVIVPGVFGGTGKMTELHVLEQAQAERVKAMAPPVQPNPDAAIDRYLADLAPLVAKVPVDPPATPQPCPAALHGKLYVVPFEYALAMRNKSTLGGGWALDGALARKDPTYDLVRYASGQAYAPGTKQRLDYLADKTPAFLRVTSVSLPDGGAKGELTGAVFAFQHGELACASAVKLASTAKDRAEFEADVRAKLDKLVVDL